MPLEPCVAGFLRTRSQRGLQQEKVKKQQLSQQGEILSGKVLSAKLATFSPGKCQAHFVKHVRSRD